MEISQTTHACGNVRNQTNRKIACKIKQKRTLTNQRVVSFDEQQLKTNLLIAIDCCLKHCCHLIGFGCMGRDEIWNTITKKKTHTHTAMMMMEYFDTQSQ